MPIDWATVNWTFVVLMGVFAFVAALLGSLISFRNRFWGAVIAGVPVRGRLSSSGITTRTRRCRCHHRHRPDLAHGARS